MTSRLALAAALLAPSLAVAASSARFVDYQDYLLTSTTWALAVADVNHDGIPDVLAGTGAGIAVLLGKPGGALTPPVIAGGKPIFVTSMTVADFNSDGHLDVVSANIANGTYLTLTLGNGDGTFQPPIGLPINCVNYGCAVAAADFNGDGKVDLAVAFSGWVTVYLGNGDGTFRGGQPRYTTRDAFFLAAGDLNRDGTPDLVVSDQVSNQIIVLLGNGDGSFQRTNFASSHAPYGLVLADFNGDGLPDVAVADGLSTLISVWINQGGGLLGNPTDIPTACTNCNLQSITSGDFNHDGKIDLATPASILYGHGDGSFQAPATFLSGSDPTVVAAADFNRDGYSDLVVGNGGATNLSLLLGNPRVVRQPLSPQVGYSPRAVATADFNGDHQADLAVVVNGANGARILLGKGNGTFTQGVTLPVASPGALVAADFNGDGNTDLAVSGETGASIFLGNGDGTFTTGAQYAGFYGDCTDNQWPAHTCFAVADFNGDGIPDLAGALWIQDQVMFLFGNGDGTFRRGPILTLSDAPQGLAAGDFNHDGKMDVVVTGYLGTVQVLPGNGDGTFASPVIIQLPIGGLAGVAAGDVDGDGNLDIVVAGGGGASFISLGVYILTGNGDLTFNPPFALVADEMPNGILLADLNGDGKLDIASANVSGNNVAVLVNQGNLKFAPAILYGTGGSPAMLVSADFNGDGLPDMASVNQYSGSLTILFHAPK
jgi:FG-GAP-like repeat